MELRERTNRSGKTSYFIDYRQDGQRRREVLKNIADPKLARLAFNEFQLRLEREEVGLPTNRKATIKEVLEAYEKELNGTVSTRYFEHTIKPRLAELKAHFGDSLPVRRLDIEAIKDFRRAMQAKEKPDSVPTINKKVAMLKAAINLAVKKRWLATNPIAGAEALSDKRGPQWAFLSLDDAERLLEALRGGCMQAVQRSGKQGNHYKAKRGKNLKLWRLVSFLLNSGARVGEALAVTWRDVDLERGQIRLLTTKKAKDGHKAEPRFIPINKALREMLASMTKSSGPLFHYPNNLNRDFEAACTAAGIDPVRVHDLRHTYASHLAMGGIPLNTIRELLGHSNITMTLRYSHLCPGVKAEAAQAINFGGSKKATAKVVSVIGA